MMVHRLLGIGLTLLTLVWLGGIGSVQSQDNKEPAPPAAGKTEATQPAPAYLRISLPRAEATLTIDDTQTRQYGRSRLFVSPPLDPGKRFTYKLVARWEPNNYTKITRRRDVTVEAGKETQVDLNVKDDKWPDDILVRYVPTPPEVVEAMLKLADVSKDDVVYDLGCGDGRLVVDAVKKFGAKRGVGVDLDPARIKDSNATAAAAGVQDKVEFRQADVLKIPDYSDASVVTLYMGEDLNQALRPILQKSLKPGSRVVSHRFTMGDWKPDKSISLIVNGERYVLHLWKIGAGSASTAP
jgi:uncharacterized protein (TIGR03000 family)